MADHILTTPTKTRQNICNQLHQSRIELKNYYLTSNFFLYIFTMSLVVQSQ